MVIDASVALSWLLQDELSTESLGILDELARVEAFVPLLWHFEVRNGILIAGKRGRISIHEIGPRIDQLATLPIATDRDPNLDEALELAINHELTFYDAMYLELACRLEVTLATFDKRLASAALAEGL